MNHLRREMAPVSEAAWEAIDAEATRTLRHFIAGRPLVDFSGPHGWAHPAANVGRIEPVEAAEGLEAASRRAQPLVELRTPFELSRAELDTIERGAGDPDLTALDDAARRAALAEDGAVFHGYAAGGITGMTEASPHQPMTITDDYHQYPGIVARAVAALSEAGVGGPYAAALGPRCYLGVIETTEHGGYPVFEHIRLILGGPIVWARAVNGAVVVSQRGGDFDFVCGQDLSIGYRSHAGDTVELYLEESFTFQVRDPRAAVALVYPSSGRRRRE